MTGAIGLEDGQAEVKINITTTVPIYSYSFTLEGFDNVLSANSNSIVPDCMAWSFFGENNRIFARNPGPGAILQYPSL